MNTKMIIRICIAGTAVLFSWAVVFGLGLYFGRDIAEESIKSELIWYNQFVLRQAVEDMRAGKLDDAERKILYVDGELNRMKHPHGEGGG